RYLGRIKHFYPIEVVEVAPQRGRQSESDAAIIRRRSESARLIAAIPPRGFTVVLDERGQPMDSLKFAKWLERLTIDQPHGVNFVSLRRKQQDRLDSYERDKAAGNQQPDDGIQDLADKAASAYSKELNFSLSDGERNLLMLIEEAFTRVKDDTYGTCTNCGNVIGDKRLLAVPWTPFCIDCQELQEKGLLG